MIEFKKIVCPTDLSEPSLEGLKYAIDVAARFGAELCVVNVIPVVPPLPTNPNISFAVPEYELALHTNAADRLRKLIAERIPKEIRSRAIIGHGDEGNEIVRIAQEEKADLIVIATHGEKGWQHFIFGSVAEKVVQRARCPVLTVRAPSGPQSQ